jgi:hypothetical protein
MASPVVEESKKTKVEEGLIVEKMNKKFHRVTQSRHRGPQS